MNALQIELLLKLPRLFGYHQIVNKIDGAWGRPLRLGYAIIATVCLSVASEMALASPRGGCPEGVDFADFLVLNPQGPPRFGGPVIRIANGAQSLVVEGSVSCIEGMMHKNSSDGRNMAAAAAVEYKPVLIADDLTRVTLLHTSDVEDVLRGLETAAQAYDTYQASYFDPENNFIRKFEGYNYSCFAAPAEGRQPTGFCEIHSLSTDDAPAIVSCAEGYCSINLSMGGGVHLGAVWNSPSHSFSERSDLAEDISTRVHAFVAERLEFPE